MSNTSPVENISIEQAFSLFQNGKLDAALNLCESLLQLNNKDLNALNLAGIIADAKNEKKEAIDYFKKAIKLQPNNPQLLTNLATTLIDIKKHSEAKQYLIRATKGKPPYAEAFYNLGNICVVEGNTDKAIKQYIRALEINPTLLNALNNLASCYTKSDRTENAKETYLRALKINPSHFDALFGLGALYFEEQDYSNAKPFISQALAKNNQHGDANFILGSIYKSEHDTEKAISHLVIAHRASPDNSSISSTLGEAYYEIGDMENAMHYFNLSIDKNPNQISAINYLGIIHHEIRNYSESISYYEKALEIEPDNSKILNNFGHVLRESGQLEKSVEILNRAIELESSLPDEKRAMALNNLGLIQLLSNDFHNGWANYRFRPSVIEKNIPICKNRDELDLSNKRVLWMQDQGIGDELFFLRFAPMLKQLNCENLYEASTKLYPLIKNNTDFDNVITGEYNKYDFDITLSIGDLPYILGHSEVENAPAPIALRCDEGLKQEVRGVLEKFGPPPYIGINWKAGRLLDNKRVGAYHKHLNFEHVSEILEDIEGTVISLQVNAKKEDLEELSVKIQRPILDVGPYHNALDKMLCLLDLLDHYIAVSNTYVHMRESLNKETHVFVSSPPEWRWLLSGENSFWMPNSNIYRQSLDGSWTGAVNDFRQNSKLIK